MLCRSNINASLCIFKPKNIFKCRKKLNKKKNKVRLNKCMNLVQKCFKKLKIIMKT